MNRLRIAAILSFVLAGSLAAQARQALGFALAVDRAPQLRQRLPQCRWLPGGHRLVQLRDDGQQQTLLAIDAGGGGEAVLATARAALAAIGRPVGDGARAAFPAWSPVDDACLRLATDDAVWHWRPGDAQAVRVLPLPLAAADRARVAVAPDDRHVAFVRDHDLVVAARDGSQHRVTWDGSADVVYGGGAHRQEFGIQGGLFWSADGSRLAFYREDQRPIEPYPYLDPTAMPPRALPGRYPMAGNVHSRVQVGVYEVADRSLRWLEADPAADQYWTNIAFTPDAAAVLVTLVDRGQDHLELVRFDAKSGRRLATLLEERNPRWLEPEHPPHCLHDGRFLCWSSRDGHRHLYLHAADGKPLLQVTRGAFDVQQLLAVDEAQATLWFHAAGADPRQRHLFRARLDGSDPIQLTRERGCHDSLLSPDRRYALDTWSNLETPPAQQLLPLDADAPPPPSLPPLPCPLADLQLPGQRLFQVGAADGSVLHGHLLLPYDLDEHRRYPVLLYVYGGPHVQLVTDSFLGGAQPWLAALANEGYLVCRLDNRGTPNRGSGFEQCIHRRLGTLEVQDQLAGLEHVLQLPFADATRVGVHGWSYGGYLTLRLMLLAPDRFACGVAGAPVTDWAMYETGYTERYMDTPAENPQGYAASSCLPLAGRLKGRLLLVQGTDDKTVMWSHSLQFVDRCIDAGVLLDYMPYPMQQHGLGGRDQVHFLRLLKDHLDRYLGGGAGVPAASAAANGQR